MKPYHAYVAAAKDGAGGVYRCEVGDDGALTPVQYAPLEGAMYLAFSYPSDAAGVSPDRLYAVIRNGNGETSPDGTASDSALTWCPLKNGEMGAFSAPVSTGGRAGAHLTIDEQQSGRPVYVANYTTGSLCRLDEGADGYRLAKFVKHSGSGPYVGRQEEPHVHHVSFTPDGRWLCAVDLGIDAVVMYDRDLLRHFTASLPPRTGPRHLIFSPDGKFAYTADELGVTVSALAYDGERLTYLRSCDLLPDGCPAAQRDLNTGAAIRISPDGGRLYVSTRFDDSIAVFEADGGNLRRLQIIPCGGCWPRDISLTPDGAFLHSSNERGDSVTAFAVGKDGLLTRTPTVLSLPAPVNVIYA